MSEELITLYRPVGLMELELIRESGFLAFPPRLSSQPFFYPVLTEQYAVQIARDWNTKDESSQFRGYVLKFRMKASFLGRYQIRTVGSSAHREYWIPSKDLEEFNRHLEGPIEVIGEFRAEK